MRWTDLVRLRGCWKWVLFPLLALVVFFGITGCVSTVRPPTSPSDPVAT